MIDGTVTIDDGAGAHASRSPLLDAAAEEAAHDEARLDQEPASRRVEARTFRRAIHRARRFALVVHRDLPAQASGDRRCARDDPRDRGADRPRAPAAPAGRRPRSARACARRAAGRGAREVFERSRPAASPKRSGAGLRRLRLARAHADARGARVAAPTRPRTAADGIAARSPPSSIARSGGRAARTAAPSRTSGRCSRRSRRAAGDGDVRYVGVGPPDNFRARRWWRRCAPGAARRGRPDRTLRAVARAARFAARVAERTANTSRAADAATSSGAPP